MILLLGMASDRPLTAVASALRRRRSPFVFLDQAGTVRPRVLEVPVDHPGGTIAAGSSAVDLTAVTSAYLRPSTGGWTAADRLVHAWANCSPARVVNRPSAMSANNSKPYQASLIRRHGFATPETLITTVPAAVREFKARHGTIIYKSISGVRSIVTRLTAEEERPLDDVRHCPTQFQAYVPGTDYRVHVVGDRIFACRVESNADDYRYARGAARPRISSHDLPSDVETQILDMVRSMSLLVAGVDLRLHPDGTWYCFEVNPSPAFTYFVSETAQPIADAIASLLAMSA